MVCTIADYALFEHTNFVCHVCFLFKDVDLSMRSLFFFSTAGAHMCHASQLMGGGWVGMMMFLALAHMRDATQLMGGGGWG